MMLDVTGRLIVIVGGGAVAVRKARGVIDAGATRVRVVAPEIGASMPASVERVAERYESRHLAGAGLVFAATDSPQVNDRVVADARAGNVLVCRADGDDDLPGDFTTPAKLQRGPVVVTVSAGSAALAARIRDELIARFDPRWQAIAEAMTDLRPAIVQCDHADPARRADALRALASDEAMDVAHAGGASALRQWLIARFPEFATTERPS